MHRPHQATAHSRKRWLQNLGRNYFYPLHLEPANFYGDEVGVYDIVLPNAERLAQAGIKCANLRQLLNKCGSHSRYWLLLLLLLFFFFFFFVFSSSSSFFLALLLVILNIVFLFCVLLLLVVLCRSGVVEESMWVMTNYFAKILNIFSKLLYSSKWVVSPCWQRSCNLSLARYKPQPSTKPQSECSSLLSNVAWIGVGIDVSHWTCSYSACHFRRLFLPAPDWLLLADPLVSAARWCAVHLCLGLNSAFHLFDLGRVLRWATWPRYCDSRFLQIRCHHHGTSACASLGGCRAVQAPERLGRLPSPRFTRT